MMHMGDNSTAVELAADNASATNAWHILRRIAFSKELCEVEDGSFAPMKVGTDDNASDFMGNGARAAAGLRGAARRAKIAVGD